MSVFDNSLYARSFPLIQCGSPRRLTHTSRIVALAMRIICVCVACVMQTLVFVQVDIHSMPAILSIQRVCLHANLDGTWNSVSGPVRLGSVRQVTSDSVRRILVTTGFDSCRTQIGSEGFVLVLCGRVLPGPVLSTLVSETIVSLVLQILHTCTNIHLCLDVSIHFRCVDISALGIRASAVNISWCLRC